MGYLPGLTSLDDVALSTRTRLDFFDSLFVHPEKVPYALKVSWLGQTMLQPAHVLKHILSRPQDSDQLHAAGRQGLPMLVFSGTEDKQVVGHVVAAEMKPYFKNFEFCAIEGGSHALFYEYQDEFVNALLKFISRVKVCLCFTCHAVDRTNLE